MGLFLIGPMLMVGETAFASSPEYCDAYAKNRASQAAPGGGAARGAAGGSLTGAAIGGIANGRKGARRGAAWGALGGAVAGGARQSNVRGAVYDQAYYECMRQEQHRY